MILINLGHPLTGEHLLAIEEQLGQRIARLVERKVQLDPDAPFADQITALVDDLGLSPHEWQSEPILVNPPTLNVIAVALLAELHGRMGYFCPMVRLRSVAGAVPPRFVVAELLDLQGLRERARHKR